MTDTRKFDELVSWHAKPVVGVFMGWDPGWRANGAAFAPNISPSDPYWNTVLDKAQATYGDPGMRFNTSEPSADRYLVFSDGTRVPTDGSLAYRDNGNTYVMNNDGSVSLLGGDGKTGQPFFPEFRRNEAGQYVPVNAQGQQVAPLAASYVDDPATGKRTYYNANGDVVGSEQRPTAAPPGGQPGVATDEQQSGRTADAVRKLHEEMKDRYSQLSEAEGKLTEAMLTARTTTAEGQQKLNDIQQQIAEAVNNPAMSLDTPAGEQAFLKFLRSQVAAIGEVLKSGTLTAEDQAKAAAALAALYDMDGASPDTGSSPSDPAQPAPATPAPAAVPSATDPGLADPALTDAGLGPMEPMPDPMLSDLEMGGPLGARSAGRVGRSRFRPRWAPSHRAAGMGGSPLDALHRRGGPAAPGWPRNWASRPAAKNQILASSPIRTRTTISTRTSTKTKRRPPSQCPGRHHRRRRRRNRARHRSRCPPAHLVKERHLQRLARRLRRRPRSRCRTARPPTRARRNWLRPSRPTWTASHSRRPTANSTSNCPRQGHRSPTRSTRRACRPACSRCSTTTTGSRSVQ